MTAVATTPADVEPEAPVAPPTATGETSVPSGISRTVLRSRVCPQCGERFPVDFKVCPRDAVPLGEVESRDDALIGTTLDAAYTLTGVLGAGAMGRVYDARHRRLRGRHYAVKVLRPELAGDVDVVARFAREVDAVSAIDHPNVLAIHDVGMTPDGRPYLVSERLEGEGLDVYLKRRGPVDVVTALRLLRPVCRAVAAAHTAGVVHRDLKPENIFLAGDADCPTPKVLDFGLSKVIGKEGQALTKVGTVIGTPAYMSPEQAMGAGVDLRTDIYSTGAVLYYLLTGRRPFERDSTMALFSAVLNEEPPRPRSIRDDIPQALEIIVQRAMAKRREDRYESMAEFDAALAQFEATLVSAPAGQGPADAAGSWRGERSASLRAAVADDATGARPRAVALSLTVYLWGVGLTAMLVVAALQSLRGAAANVSGAEAFLALFGAVALTAMPGVLWAYWLARRRWGNSLLVASSARHLARILGVGATVYALSTLAVQVVVVLGMRDAAVLGWGGWRVVTAGAALAVTVAMTVRALRSGFGARAGVVAVR